ncbi:hypothetical protein MYAM1_002295 [Malassezia yamatoensis]|uniref:RNI-like protein n=1 Tax=Malassezia yamatoensis TaxID=253288 RepID=A0AAJ6CHS3_9BASI|nr:hypothetical protein MYAM1_002295 [Malassezia yamatoensis]
MSPFPPTYNENLSRRSVPQSPQQGIPTLKDIALNVAAMYFSTHIIPTYDRSAETRARQSSNKPYNKKRQRRDEDYIPEEVHSESSAPPQPSHAGLNNADALWCSEINRDILKHMPPAVINDLFEAICLHSPTSLTKDVISTYFLPHVAPEKENSIVLDDGIPPLPPNSRIRTRIFFPASLPLFSQDFKAATLMLSVLAGSLALSPSSLRLTSMIDSLDFHGLTRLPTAALIRLLRAPPRPPRAQIPTWNLSRVTLPGCTAIGDAAIATLAEAAGPTLEQIDLAMTSITTAAIRTLGTSCPQLRSLRLAWCENFGDTMFSDAISACVDQCANMTPALIPFQRLVSIDLSHTSVGDVGIAGLLHLCGTQLESLDVGWTKVAEDGCLDMLSLGLGMPLNQSTASAHLHHLGLAGLCVRSESLLQLVLRLLGPDGNLSSLFLDDLVEYSRRHQSSLQGRQGLTGATLYAISNGIEQASKRRECPFRRFHARGDKRRVYVSGHWNATGIRIENDILPIILRNLIATCEEVALNGLQLELDEVSPDTSAPPCTRIFYLNGTGLRDSNLQALIPYTGTLRSVYLDDTQVTSYALDQLIDKNPYLSLLSLSQCRGIPVRSRRSYFDSKS